MAKGELKRYAWIIYFIFVSLFLLRFGLLLISTFLFLLPFLLSYFLCIVKSQGRFVYVLSKTLLILALSYSGINFIRTFIMDIYKVPSSSMERSISARDYILVDKYFFGTTLEFDNSNRFNSFYYASFYDEDFTDNKLIIKGLFALERNDICVARTLENKRIVKRVIGLPGEVLQIKSDTVYINNLPLEFLDYLTFSYINLSSRISSKSIGTVTYTQLEYEALPNEIKRNLRKLNGVTGLNSELKEPLFYNWSANSFGPVAIPSKDSSLIIHEKFIKWYGTNTDSLELLDNQSLKISFKEDAYFLLGDNRYNSIDSRQLGPIPNSLIEGKVLSIIKLSI